MAVPKVARTYPQTQQPIIIERREIIGQVDPDPNGEKPMLVVAFEMMGKFFTDNDDARGIELGFEFFGRRFTGAIHPDEELLKARANQGLDDEYDG